MCCQERLLDFFLFIYFVSEYNAGSPFEVNWSCDPARHDRQKCSSGGNENAVRDNVDAEL